MLPSPRYYCALSPWWAGADGENVASAAEKNLYCAHASGVALDDGVVEGAGQTCCRQTTKPIALDSRLEAKSPEFVKLFPRPRLAKIGADSQRVVTVSYFANADC